MSIELPYPDSERHLYWCSVQESCVLRRRTSSFVLQTCAF